MKSPSPAWLAAATLTLAACSPALDWRQVRPDDTGVEAMFPCKPLSHARTVPMKPIGTLTFGTSDGSWCLKPG